jgi:hypothetical protein
VLELIRTTVQGETRVTGTTERLALFGSSFARQPVVDGGATVQVVVDGRE